MEQSESNVIEHLLEVESLASTLTVEARNKAAEIVNEAKAKSEKDFLDRFNLQASELEKSFNEDSAKINEKVALEINSYKEEISKSVQDRVAFNSLMDRLVKQK